MFEFVPFKIGTKCPNAKDFWLSLQILKLAYIWRTSLFDDFALQKYPNFYELIKNLTSTFFPYFWAVLKCGSRCKDSIKTCPGQVFGGGSIFSHKLHLRCSSTLENREGSAGKGETADFCGFVYFYDVMGEAGKNPYSACVTACLRRKFWGNDAQIAAHEFLELCQKAGIKRLKAQCFSNNPYSAKILKNAGFEREGILKKEAFVQGRAVDLALYGRIFKEK